MRAQRRGIRDRIGARHHIGHQPLVAGHILARDHRRLRHTRMPQQRRLDLAGLDAEPAQLHLRIRAPEELEHPVRRASAPDLRCGTSGSRPAQTDRQRTAPPSAPRAPDSRAPVPHPRCRARPRPRPAPAAGPRPERKPRVAQIGRPIGMDQYLVPRRRPRSQVAIDRRFGRTVGVDELRHRRVVRPAARSVDREELRRPATKLVHEAVARRLVNDASSRDGVQFRRLILVSRDQCRQSSSGRSNGRIADDDDQALAPMSSVSPDRGSNVEASNAAAPDAERRRPKSVRREFAPCTRPPLAVIDHRRPLVCRLSLRCR